VTDYARESTPIARKRYPCDAAAAITASNYGEQDFDPDDWRIIQQAAAAGNAILPGTRYVLQIGIWEGNWYAFRARPDLHGICLKYDLYGAP